MKAKNLYYREFHKPQHLIEKMSLFLFVFIFSWPRIMLEVFIRRNFGVRYFSFFKAIVISVVLFFPPIIIDFFSGYYQGGTSLVRFIFKDLTWYIGLAAFIYYSFQRKREIKREPGIFDFAKFTYYNGNIHPRFWMLRIRGIEPTRRNISIILEPAFFLLIGIALVILQQKIGTVVVFCSICYSLGYYGEYLRGDHFVMDKIDEMISNEELVENFVNGSDSQQTRGFEAIGQKPVNADFRRKVAKSFFDEDDIPDVY